MIGAWALIRGLSIWAQLGSIAVVLVLVWGSYKLWEHRIYRQGYDAAIADIVAQNKEANDAADQLRARMRDCRATPGMRWSQTARECQRAE